MRASEAQDAVDVLARVLAAELASARALVKDLARARVVLAFEDEDGELWERTLLLDDEVWTAAGEVPLPGAAEARISGRLQAFLDVLAGRMEARDALREGEVVLTGRPEILHALASAFRERKSPLDVRLGR